MPEGISNNYNNKYEYTNTELKKYDTDEDGSLSVFELENIEDKQAFELLAEELGYFQTPEEENEESTELSFEDQTKELKIKLSTIKDEQGIISSAWNAIKCFTGIGSSTNKCQNAIEDFKNGKISYEEVDKILSEFTTKQKDSVNLVSNIATGLTSVLAVGTAVMTGGLSIAAGAAIGAGVGAATKAGLKFADRATNKVKGDALDGKQITKDALSGAVDGAISVATMGIGTSAVTAKTVTSQSIKQTMIQGAKVGALDGAISGAVTGAADYSIEAVLEEEIEFNITDLAKTTAMNTVGGAIAGGTLGGASSGIQYKSMKDLLQVRYTKYPKVSQDVINELTDQAARINKNYNGKINEAQNQIKNVFDGDSSVAILTGRPKSENSTFEKLITKFNDGDLIEINDLTCYNTVADGLGTRLQMHSLTKEESQKIIKEKLKETGVSEEQFARYIQRDINGFNETTIKNCKSIIDTLKETQTEKVFENLKKGIIDGNITITELNNYGNDISSYFTPKQVQELVDIYNDTIKSPIKIKTQMDDSYNANGISIDCDDKGNTTITNQATTLKDKGAIKDSGYTSSQMNIIHKFKDGTEGLGEFQIRGTEVNEFADVEHIPYDIRQDKISADDATYSEIYKLIKGMDVNTTYKDYNTYLTKVYDWLRLKELGIEIPEPNIHDIMKNSNLSNDSLNLLSREGLINLAKTPH